LVGGLGWVIDILVDLDGGLPGGDGDRRRRGRPVRRLRGPVM